MKEAEVAKDEFVRMALRRFAHLSNCQHRVLSVVTRVGVDLLSEAVRS
jgi:hypothetical protein